METLTGPQTGVQRFTHGRGLTWKGAAKDHQEQAALVLIEADQTVQREIEQRLAWPQDPTYDLRYLGHSGIDDPYALGLLTATEGTPK